MEAQENCVCTKDGPLREGGLGAANSKNLVSQNFKEKLNPIQKHNLSIQAPEV